MTAERAAELVGLVLAGGRSRRMGVDKGAIDIGGQPQAERCLGLLTPFCRSVHVSVRQSQSTLAPYRDLPVLIDEDAFAGPAAGLLTAWSRMPDQALLVLAVDLLLVTGVTLEYLVSHRSPSAGATAFRHPDGTIEPLCSIWEPSLCEPAELAGDAPSLRQILEQSEISLLDPPDSDELVSANTPGVLESALRALEARGLQGGPKSPI